MKFIVALCFLALAAVACADEIRFIPVLERTEVHHPSGEFQLRYVSGDQTVVSEQGVLKPTLDGKDKVLIKEGEYTFVGPDGHTYRTAYVADHLGFRAVGDHLPKSVVA